MDDFPGFFNFKKRAIVQLIAHMPPDENHILQYNTPDTGVPCCHKGKYIARRGGRRHQIQRSKGKKPAGPSGVEEPEMWEYLSTGFTVELEGKPYVVTTAHSVPSNREFLEVMHPDQLSFSFYGDLVFHRKGIDLALLSLKDLGSEEVDFEYIDVSSNPPPLIGSNLITIGHPMQLDYSFLRGYLASSGTKRLDTFLRPADKELDFSGDLEVLHIKNQHGQNGSSSGPIFDVTGNLVGMMSFILFGYDFAIPVMTIKKFLDDFLVYKKEEEKKKELQLKKDKDEEEQHRRKLQHGGGKEKQQEGGGKGKQGERKRSSSSHSASQSGQPNKKRVLMDGLETLYARAIESPIHVEECRRLTGEISSAQGWINWAKQCVSAKPPRRIEVDDLHTLKLQMLDLEVQFPEAKFLLDLSEKAEAWQAHGSEILKGPIVLKELMIGLETLYARATKSPIYLEECGRIAGEISSAQGWIDWAKQCVSAKPPTRIEVDDLHTLKLQYPEAEFLLDLSEKAEAWQAHCSEILKGPIVLKELKILLKAQIAS